MTENVIEDDVKVVTFRLDGVELADLDGLAKKESRSRSSLLVKLVRLAIARQSSDIFFTPAQSHLTIPVTRE